MIKAVINVSRAILLVIVMCGLALILDRHINPFHEVPFNLQKSSNNEPMYLVWYYLFIFPVAGIVTGFIAERWSFTRRIAFIVGFIASFCSTMVGLYLAYVLAAMIKEIFPNQQTRTPTEVLVLAMVGLVAAGASAALGHYIAFRYFRTRSSQSRNGAG